MKPVSFVAAALCAAFLLLSLMPVAHAEGNYARATVFGPFLTSGSSAGLGSILHCEGTEEPTGSNPWKMRFVTASAYGDPSEDSNYGTFTWTLTATSIVGQCDVYIGLIADGHCATGFDSRSNSTATASGKSSSGTALEATAHGSCSGSTTPTQRDYSEGVELHVAISFMGPSALPIVINGSLSAFDKRNTLSFGPPPPGGGGGGD